MFFSCALLTLTLAQCGPAGCPFRSQPIPQASPFQSQPIPQAPVFNFPPSTFCLPIPQGPPMPFAVVGPAPFSEKDWGWHLIDHDGMRFPVWGYHLDAKTVRWRPSLPANAEQLTRAYQLHHAEWRAP
jgi:hypothetical protein